MRTSRIVWVATLLMIVIGVRLTVWRGASLTGVFGSIASPAIVGTRSLMALFDIAVSGDDLVRENGRLKDELTSAQAANARLHDIAEENVFLRAVAGLREKIPGEMIEGAAFSYLHDGGVRHMVINRGSDDGVEKGDVVATGTGALVGQVIDLFPRFAVVRAVGDPSLEVTARILGADISGLVRLDPVRGLILDLVQKSETVTEEQVVVTSGNDRFPAGLVIGSVRSVDTESATLFKGVQLTSLVSERFDGRIIILK